MILIKNIEMVAHDHLQMALGMQTSFQKSGKVKPVVLEKSSL